MSTVTLTRCVKGILSLITWSTFRAVLFCYRVTLKQFSLSGGGRRCLEDRFWISTDLSHGEGVRDGDAGAICGQRNKTESERHLTPDTHTQTQARHSTVLLLDFTSDKCRIMKTNIGDVLTDL